MKLATKHWFWLIQKKLHNDDQFDRGWFWEELKELVDAGYAQFKEDEKLLNSEVPF